MSPRHRRGWLLGLVTTAFALAGCAAVEPAREEAAATAEVMYDAEVTTLSELRATSEAVVLAAPLPGDEQVLLDKDGIQVLGRRFRVLRAVDGPLATGAEIVVTRARYGVSPDTKDRLAAKGAQVSEADAADAHEPPFDHPLYLLGLRYTGQDYPVTAWAPANGPHSRVPFDSAQLADAIGVVEVPGTPLQQRLDGVGVGVVLARLSARR